MKTNINMAILGVFSSLEAPSKGQERQALGTVLSQLDEAIQSSSSSRNTGIYKKQLWSARIAFDNNAERECLQILEQMRFRADRAVHRSDLRSALARELQGYDEVQYSFFGGRVVEKGGKYGVIDKNRNESVKPQYDKINACTGVELILIKVGDKWGIIDKNGNEVLKPKYDEISSLPGGERLLIRSGDKWGAIDFHGNEIVKPEYDRLNTFQDSGCTAAMKGEKYGLIDKNGKILAPFHYDHIHGYFWHGLTSFELNGKTGFMNKDGQIVIKPEYDDASSFSGPEGTARVRKGNKEGYLDIKGNFTPLRRGKLGEN